MWLIPSQIRASCPCLQGAEGLTSESGSPGPEPELFVTVSGTPTLRPFSWRGWRSRPWSRRLFGAATSDSSTGDRFAEWWTESLRARHASRTQSQDGRKGTTTTDPTETETAPSRRCSESSGKSGLAGAFSRMSLHGSQEDIFSQSGSDYSTWVTNARNRSFCLRQILAQRINGSGSGSWPTPDVSMLKHDRYADDGKVMVQHQHPDRGTNLARAARVILKTPNVPNGGRGTSHAQRIGGTLYHNGKKVQEVLESQARQWSTPTARDYKDGAEPSENVPTNGLLGRQAPRMMLDGDTSSNDGRSTRRRLNPIFVQWLMGWPIGWTRATTSYGASETEWCRWWQRSRSMFLRLTS